MRGASALRKPLPSVFATDLRTALNECASERELRACADRLNSLAFLDLAHEDQVELAALYQSRFYKITGALA